MDNNHGCISAARVDIQPQLLFQLRLRGGFELVEAGLHRRSAQRRVDEAGFAKRLHAGGEFRQPETDRRRLVAASNHAAVPGRSSTPSRCQ